MSDTPQPLTGINDDDDYSLYKERERFFLEKYRPKTKIQAAKCANKDPASSSTLAPASETKIDSTGTPAQPTSSTGNSNDTSIRRNTAMSSAFQESYLGAWLAPRVKNPKNPDAELAEEKVARLKTVGLEACQNVEDSLKKLSAIDERLAKAEVSSTDTNMDTEKEKEMETGKGKGNPQPEQTKSEPEPEVGITSSSSSRQSTTRSLFPALSARHLRQLREDDESAFATPGSSFATTSEFNKLLASRRRMKAAKNAELDRPILRLETSEIERKDRPTAEPKQTGAKPKPELELERETITPSHPLYEKPWQRPYRPPNVRIKEEYEPDIAPASLAPVAHSKKAIAGQPMQATSSTKTKTDTPTPLLLISDAEGLDKPSIAPEQTGAEAEKLLSLNPRERWDRHLKLAREYGTYWGKSVAKPNPKPKPKLKPAQVQETVKGSTGTGTGTGTGPETETKESPSEPSHAERLDRPSVGSEQAEPEADTEPKTQTNPVPEMRFYPRELWGPSSSPHADYLYQRHLEIWRPVEGDRAARAEEQAERQRAALERAWTQAPEPDPEMRFYPREVWGPSSSPHAEYLYQQHLEIWRQVEANRVDRAEKEAERQRAALWRERARATGKIEPESPPYNYIEGIEQRTSKPEQVEAGAEPEPEEEPEADSQPKPECERRLFPRELWGPASPPHADYLYQRHFKQHCQFVAGRAAEEEANRKRAEVWAERARAQATGSIDIRSPLWDYMEGSEQRTLRPDQAEPELKSQTIRSPTPVPVPVTVRLPPSESRTPWAQQARQRFQREQESQSQVSASPSLRTSAMTPTMVPARTPFFYPREMPRYHYPGRQPYTFTPSITTRPRPYSLTVGGESTQAMTTSGTSGGRSLPPTTMPQLDKRALSPEEAGEGAGASCADKNATATATATTAKAPLSGDEDALEDTDGFVWVEGEEWK